MKILDFVRGKTAKFVFYRDGNLMYQIDGTDFLFPIPISDTGKGTFSHEHPAINLMRWIRQHMPHYEEMKAARNPKVETIDDTVGKPGSFTAWLHSADCQRLP